MRFSGKKIIVTGAASGIGRATAIKFAAEGAQVTIGDINEAGLAETASMMASAPLVQPYDAADFDTCRALLAAGSADGLDVLCNVGGMLDWGPTPDFSEEKFDRILRVNLSSVYALCRAAIPHLIESKGNIVNTASTAGLVGIAYTLAYSASKHGVIAITKSLAIELASKEVRVNAICPGQVNTAMGHAAPPEGDIDWGLVMRNVGKLGNGSAEPSDIADAFAFLASDEARKISGTTLTVDCAMLAG